MELANKINAVLEKYNSSLRGKITGRCSKEGRYNVKLELFSPKGEDVIISLTYDGTEEDFISVFVEYADRFSAEERTEWIKDILMEVADALIRSLLDDTIALGTEG